MSTILIAEGIATSFIVLFVLLIGFGVAVYVPKRLAAQRGEPFDPDDPR